jgi:hypothetical protein
MNSREGKYMSVDFQCNPTPKETFTDLFSMDAGELETCGARRMTVRHSPGTPCRVSLEDAPVGEQVILVPFKHHNVDTPYQASGPIFVREQASTARYAVNEVPEMLLRRLLSVRAYDAEGMMLDAEVIAGEVLENAIRRLFENDKVATLHVHNAAQGCFNCSVSRA